MARAPQPESHALLQRRRGVFVVHAVADDDHVIHTHSQEHKHHQQADDGARGADVAAEPQGRGRGQQDGDHAGRREQEAALDEGPAAQDQRHEHQDDERGAHHDGRLLGHDPVHLLHVRPHRVVGEVLQARPGSLGDAPQVSVQGLLPGRRRGAVGRRGEHEAERLGPGHEVPPPRVLRHLRPRQHRSAGQGRGPPPQLRLRPGGGRRPRVARDLPRPERGEHGGRLAARLGGGPQAHVGIGSPRPPGHVPPGALVDLRHPG
mmetsp:Transcript_5441/g.15333  ORF Transcript_5441/g.15333 Transcript_5441/m.15333 type:complete len:262 (+) Transcript_5441:1595-2380(+)